MTLTKKEQGLLKDLQNEEKLCVEKYRKAAENACDAKLQHIFEKIEKAEQSHYDTVTGMLAGTLPAQQGQQSKGQASRQKAEKDLKSTASRAEKQRDAYLLSDLLGTEKYVSGVYNTAVFEFSDAKARQVLAAIQQQEQEHGKQLSDYMQANNMYCRDTIFFIRKGCPRGGPSFWGSFSSGSCGRCRTAPVSYCPRCPACPQ